ncbi:SusC/RagA family TonB-linked outer membrane protein [Hymenobacter tibetensis]|uniref:SusC/RagA family TonB-linked outer membrane protein n=1 Tax=Hymenobacter tibetensis TaxID=497967 RepID=A0ABY4CUZ7_9BACT|nr:SusC/RagA family TonB-linked outer membrane protein [Hymenobacter tibetensis]UOG72836.1 SusC/RagA family TonB-linked outer membrane protein [Hymenobacter tibetensis]
MPFSIPVPRRARPLQWALLPTLGSVFLPGIAAANPAGLAVNVSLLATAPVAGGTITGRVVDASGEGLPGVTVVLEGTSLGASTDGTGAYSIANVPAGSYTLVTSYVGFKANRTPIIVTEGGTTAVPVATLAENTTLLSEAVVIGYGSQRRQDVTGAVEQIDEKQFVKGQVTTPEQLIQGKVAGVQITTASGAPGATTDIRIRGGSSLNASNSPLVVIDGVPVDNTSLAGNSNPLSLINPNDIESITVLKDASSTAIYGSRASNGVIIVTTKRGLQGEALRVNVSTQHSLAKPADFVPVLLASEFRATVDQYGNDQQKATLGTASTDWQKEIFRTAYTTDNTVSLIGSAGKVPFRVSGGYLNQQGLLLDNSLKRYSGSVGVTPLLLDDNLRIDINIKGSLIKNNFSAQDAVNRAVYFDPTQPVYAADSPFGGFFEFTDNGNIRTLAPRNPVGLIKQREDLSTVKRSIGNIQLDYKLPFVAGLSANVNLGYDVQRSDGTLFVPGAAGSDFLRGGINREYKQGLNNTLLETYAKYNRDFGKAKLEVLGGYSWQQFQNEQYRFDDNRADGTVYVAAERTYDNQLSFTDQYNLLSYYGRANLNINDRYLVTGTLRADGSSRFSPDNRWGYFPSGAVAWRIKGEDFLKESTTISDLKIRFGVGQTGQQDIGTGSGNLYGYLPFYSLSSNLSQYPQGSNYYRTLRAEFYDLNRKWETTTTYNAGIDYGFFGGRVYGSVDVYKRDTKDLLNTVFLAALTNQTNAGTINVGSLTNKGVEVAVNVDAVKGDQLNLSLNANATFNRNELTKLTNSDSPNAVGVVVSNSSIYNFDGEPNQNAQINTVGYQEGAFYVYEQKYGTDGKPLLNEFVDRNNDGTVDSRDLYRYKSPRPKAILGFGGNLTYAKASLAFTFRSNLGGYLYNNQRSRSLFSQNSNGFIRNSGEELLYSGFTQNASNQFLSDYYVEDASFLRLQNVTVGYDFGELVRKGTTFNVSLAAQNLFLITDYKGLDPEVNTGVDNTIYPRARTITVGLNLGF